MITYRLINYFDVWGNKKDGWEINDLCTEFEEIESNKIETNELLLKYLKSIGFFKKHVRLNMLVIEDCYDDIIEIYAKKDMYPICRLERE